MFNCKILHATQWPLKVCTGHFKIEIQIFRFYLASNLYLVHCILCGILQIVLAL